MAAPPTQTALATMLGSTGTTTLVLVIMLIALGIAMVLTAVWLVVATRADTPALAPLEAMGTRRWARGDTDGRAALLTAARPNGALGPAPVVPYGDDAEPSATDLSPAAPDLVPAVVPVAGAAPEPDLEPADETVVEATPSAEPEPEPLAPEPVDAMPEPVDAAPDPVEEALEPVDVSEIDADESERSVAAPESS